MTSAKAALPIALNNSEPSSVRQRAALILASASPRRRELLAQIGVIPDDIIPADIDETPLTLPKGKTERVRPYVERVAREKALAIHKAYPHAIILSADTAVSVGTRILPKTETEDEVRACLALLSGRSHRVYSGVCVLAPGFDVSVTRVVETRVKVRHLNEQAVEAYIDTDEWRGKAGGYAIQGQFACHIIAIHGSYTNVVGLPLYETKNLLTGVGWLSNS